MSKYLILGIALAISTSLLFMRIAQPDWFFSLFGGKEEKTIVYANTPELTTHTVNTPISSNGKKIQLALILDTSNSMDGLIEQAKSQLWMLVNELVGMEKNGQTPDIQIALYQFGNDELSVYGGFVQQVSPFSTDLDLISKKLFELTTNGGSEYCGYAIKNSLAELEWTNNPNDLKMVFIAGNEPFNQGPVGYLPVVKAAQQHNIIVNTIHCGSYDEGRMSYWADAAKNGGGEYLNIDHNDQVVHIPTPYDDEIIQLNSQLNSTYIYYGADGNAKAEEQVTQDRNAMKYSSANFRTRAMVKSKKVYDNSEWDLVDLQTRSGDANAVVTLADSSLPDNMRGMSEDERVEYVEEKSAERETIKAKLNELESKVKEHVAKERAKMKESNTLDNVMLATIRKQAGTKDFKATK